MRRPQDTFFISQTSIWRGRVHKALEQIPLQKTLHRRIRDQWLANAGGDEWDDSYEALFFAVALLFLGIDV